MLKLAQCQKMSVIFMGLVYKKRFKEMREEKTQTTYTYTIHMLHTSHQHCSIQSIWLASEQTLPLVAIQIGGTALLNLYQTVLVYSLLYPFI